MDNKAKQFFTIVSMYKAIEHAGQKRKHTKKSTTLKQRLQ
jgi:hypothetical protein